MTAYKLIGWLMLAACMVATVRAAPGDEAAASAVQAASPVAKKISANPEQDYEKGLKLQAAGDRSGDLSAYMDAAEHFRLAADAGHAGAQAYYALSLERGQMLTEAVEYYRMSADQGNMDGQFGLGSVYLAGEGVPQDLLAGRKLITLAAEQGHKAAINTLVNAYLQQVLTAEEVAQLKPKLAKAYIRNGMGLGEAEGKSPEALLWIRRAADNGSLVALDALAAAYRTGQYGLAVDVQQANEIVAKADKLRGVVPKEVRKKSALYRLLRGDDSNKDAAPAK